MHRIVHTLNLVELLASKFICLRVGVDLLIKRSCFSLMVFLSLILVLIIKFLHSQVILCTLLIDH